MDFKDIERRIKKIIKDNSFEFRKGSEVADTIKLLEFIIIEIAKSNDALGTISFMKEYYSELFEENRYSLFLFETNCEELDRMIENHRDIYAIYFKDFIEEIICNKDFDKIFEEEFPYLHKIIKIIKYEDEFDEELEDIIDYLEGWINIISYDDINADLLDSLEDEFRDYYEKMIEE